MSCSSESTLSTAIRYEKGGIRIGYLEGNRRARPSEPEKTLFAQEEETPLGQRNDIGEKRM